MSKTVTGNSISDFVTSQAFGLGLDPDIFLNNQFFKKSKSSFSPTKKANDSQQNLDQILSPNSPSFSSNNRNELPPEVIEVANLLKQAEL